MLDISICMVTYNHEAFIAKAIEGVLMQETSYSYKLIIGEDCSQDSTRQICETYAAKYPDKIMLLNSKKNLGAGNNFLRVLDECKGNYIALCEGDDYWIDKNKLQKQIEFLEKNNNYSLCFHDVYHESNGKRKKSSLWDSPDTSDLNYLLSHKGYISTLSVVFRNDISIFSFLKESLESPFSDFFLYVALAKLGLFKFFPKRMGVYSVHTGGVWSSLGFIKAMQNTVKGYQILSNLLTEEEKELLKVKYLLLLEDYYMSDKILEYEVNDQIFINNDIYVDEYIIKFIKNSCEHRKKMSYYVTSVPFNLLVKAVLKKVKNKF
ncbi:MAG: glycosyltransferase [Ferruginibacter sp.]